MKNRIKRAAGSLLLIAALFGTFASAALTAHGAGYTYGSFAMTPGSTKGLLTYRTLDARQVQLCDLATFVCDPSVTSTPPAIVGEIGQGSYTLSPSGKLALIAEMSAAGAPINSIYQVVNGTIANPKVLPVTGTISRIIFTPDENRAVVRVGAAVTLVDLRTNTAIASVTLPANDFFSFPQVSPDGRFFAYYSPATQSAPTRSFRLVNLLTGKLYTLSDEVPYWDLLSEEDTIFQFSPDSAVLIYKDDREGPQTLYRVNLANLKGTAFKGTRVFTKKYSVSDFMLTDAHTLLYIANRETPLRFDLFSYDLAKETLKTVAANASYYPPMKRAGDIIIFNQLTSWGSQVMAYNLKTKTTRSFAQPQGTFTVLKPGTDIALPGGIHGALLLPDNFNAKTPHQLVVWLHGGPYRQTSLGYHPYPSYGVYDWMLEGLRSSGVVVLKLDYSGSFGYGRPFAESLKGTVGVKDVKDVLSAVASLGTKYSISQTHLMGVSYGGYLSLRALVEKPAAFASAISINGVTDWLTLVNNNPNTIFAADFEGPLTEMNESIYDRASILAKVPGLANQKVVLLHSSQDSEVSYSQSSSFNGILKAAGKNVLFTPLPDDDHVLGYQSNAVMVCNTVFQTVGVPAGGKCVLGNN